MLCPALSTSLRACAAPHRRARSSRPRLCAPRAAAGDDEDRPPTTPDDTAASFSQELKRRQRVHVEDLAPKPLGGERQSTPREGWAERGLGSQDQRVLGNEGLEGLPRRGLELLRLGGSAFIPFLPFMFVFSVLFTATFLVFGESFLHSGDYYTTQGIERSQGKSDATGGGAPPYIIPEALLAEPTFDRMVPFYEPPQ